MPEDPSAHVRAPRQARSRRTLDRIAGAALDLVAEKGVEGATVAEIVERAGSSVGSFYARFPGKDDLLLYLQDRVWEEAMEAWARALDERDWTAMDLHRLAEELVGILLRWHREGAGRRRALGRAARTRAPGEEDPERAFHVRVLRDLRSIVLRRSEEITHPSPELAVQFGYRILLGSIRELSDLGRGDGGPQDDGILVDELARAFLAYLGVGGLPARDVHEGEAEFGDPFDIWG